MEVSANNKREDHMNKMNIKLQLNVKRHSNCNI